MNKNKAKREYSVGYKRPPSQTQFKPGKSGNPKGRPKKVPALPDILAKELRRLVPVKSNGKLLKVSMLEAIVKQNLNKAAGGDLRAASLIFNQLRANKPGSGDNLSVLVAEFRAIHAKHVMTDQNPEKTNS